MTIIHYNKMDPYETNRIPVNYKNMTTVEQKYKGKFTRKQIKEYAQKLSDDLKKKNIKGEMSVALKFDVVGWRAGYFTDFGDKVRLYDSTDSNYEIEDPKYFHEFTIYFCKAKNLFKKGGADKHNDCLFKALKLALRSKLPWSKPAKLKKYLDLERDAKIHINLMPKIENKLKNYKITVTGDHIYVSAKECLQEIRLKLLNGHYTLDKSAIKIIGTSFIEKEIMIYKNTPDGIQFYCDFTTGMLEPQISKT